MTFAAHVAAILGLVALTLANARISGTAVSPAVVFSALWSVLLTVWFLARRTLSPPSIEALFVFVVGAVAFSVGAAFVHTGMRDAPARSADGRRGQAKGGRHAPKRSAYAARRKRRHRAQPRGSRARRRARLQAYVPDDRIVARAAVCAILFLVVSLPAYISYAVRVARIGDGNGFLYSIRRGAVLLGDRPVAEIDYTLWYVFVINLPYVALLAALAAVAECRERRGVSMHAAMLVGLSLTYGLLTASVGPTLSLLGGVLGIVMVQRREVPWRLLSLIGAAFAVAFSFLAVATDKEGSLIRVFTLYLVGGLVAFSSAIEHAGVVPANWSIWRFFELTANKLGAKFDVPSLHLPYVDIAPDMPMNAYTMYFAYFPTYGYIGLILLTALVGYATSFVFVRAARGARAWQVGYGMVVASILTTGLHESFWMDLNFHVKGAAFLYALYGLPRLLHPGRRHSPAPRRSGTAGALG